jgi:hypothetical protein
VELSLRLDCFDGSFFFHAMYGENYFIVIMGGGGGAWLLRGWCHGKVVRGSCIIVRVEEVHM